jgi:hypothetical protein
MGQGKLGHANLDQIGLPDDERRPTCTHHRHERVDAASPGQVAVCTRPVSGTNSVATYALKALRCDLTPLGRWGMVHNTTAIC